MHKLISFKEFQLNVCTKIIFFKSICKVNYICNTDNEPTTTILRYIKKF